MNEPSPASPKAVFDMTLFDDDETRRKLTMLNRMETMFDDVRNLLPPEYYYFSDRLPLGTTIRVTFEVVDGVDKP